MVLLCFCKMIFQRLLPDRNTIRLLRIPFSFFLMPVFLLAASGVEKISWPSTLAGFFILHGLVFPSSNGYNSYVDRDETSIGGLEKPPLPTESLFHLTIILDILAILLGFWLVSPLFSIGLLLYILASRAYSSPTIRLKKYPIWSFLVVVFFQGGFCWWLSRICLEPDFQIFQSPSWGWIWGACSLQLAGAYPLTQIYQHDADKKSGVRTISLLLGYKGTFLFSSFFFLLANVSYFFYFQTLGQSQRFMILQVFFAPVLVFFFWWMRKVWQEKSHANFSNTMKMNKVAAICMNACFLVLNYLQHSH